MVIMLALYLPFRILYDFSDNVIVYPSVQAN